MRQLLELRSHAHQADGLRQLRCPADGLRSGRTPARWTTAASAHSASRRAVTNGLPSRSPPIQRPAAGSAPRSIGILRPLCLQARLRCRVQPRHLAQEGVPIIGQPVLDLVAAPSSRSSRRMRVCHSVRIDAAQILFARPHAPPASGCRRSRSASRRAISSWQSRMLLRCTSVGCAVSTGRDQRIAEKTPRPSAGANPGLALRAPAPAQLPSLRPASRRSDARADGDCDAGPRRCWRAGRSR